jgi:hypothetical protein
MAFDDNAVTIVEDVRRQTALASDHPMVNGS